MAKYMIQGSYTAEGVKGLMKDGGTGRKAAVEKMAQSVGGQVESVYFAFGHDDVFVIADLPDNTTASAVALAAGASGLVRVRTVVLMTPEEVDAAVSQAIDYQPPGG